MQWVRWATASEKALDAGEATGTCNRPMRIEKWSTSSTAIFVIGRIYRTAWAATRPSLCIPIPAADCDSSITRVQPSAALGKGRLGRRRISTLNTLDDDEANDRF